LEGTRFCVFSPGQRTAGIYLLLFSFHITVIIDFVIIAIFLTFQAFSAFIFIVYLLWIYVHFKKQNLYFLRRL